MSGLAFAAGRTPYSPSVVSFARGTMEIYRAPKVKDHGAWYFDWENQILINTVEGCVITPGPSAENNDRQTAELILYSVVAPYDADVRATDKVRVSLEPGLDLAVEGRPQRAVSPTGNLNHTIVQLREWKVT